LIILFYLFFAGVLISPIVKTFAHWGLLLFVPFKANSMPKREILFFSPFYSFLWLFEVRWQIFCF